MNIDLYRRGLFNRLLCLGHLVRRAVRDQQELVRLQRHLILENAVLGDTDAVQAGADRAQPTHDDRSLQGGYDPGGNGTRYQHRPNTRHEKERGAEQQAPDATPKGTHFSQYFMRSPAL